MLILIAYIQISLELQTIYYVYDNAFRLFLNRKQFIVLVQGHGDNCANWNDACSTYRQDRLNYLRSERRSYNMHSGI